MKALQAWLLGLLLLGLALRGAASQTHPHSMEIRSECPTLGISLLHPPHPPPPPGTVAHHECPCPGRGAACCSPGLSREWPGHLLPSAPAAARSTQLRGSLAFPGPGTRPWGGVGGAGEEGVAA